eukprot:1184151-Prorocentrum_minimum.AAC.3
MLRVLETPCSPLASRSSQPEDTTGRPRPLPGVTTACLRNRPAYSFDSFATALRPLRNKDAAAETRRS